MLRTGKISTLHPCEGTARILSYPSRYLWKHRNWQETVSAQIRGRRKHRGAQMAEVRPMSVRATERLHGRGRRSVNLSTKLTTDEARAIEDAAARAGKTPSEWARELLLRPEVVGKLTEMEMHIFTELVGIQMLLMSALEPILRGESVAEEQIAILFRQVQTTKAMKAQELLAKRTQNKEK